MPRPLKNLRHERFCRAYVHGPHAGNRTEAYAAAGYNYDRGNASRLAAAPRIKKRIADLIAQDSARELRARDAEIARRARQLQKALAPVARVAFANPFDCLAFGTDGSVTLDEAALARNKGAIEVATLRTRTRGGQRKRHIRVRMKNKLAALEQLLGLYDKLDRLDHGRPVSAMTAPAETAAAETAPSETES